MKSRGCLLMPLLFLVLLSPWSSFHCPLRPSNGRSRRLVSFASAELINITIDDTSSLISYLPAGKWRPSTEPCTTCLQPDVRLAYAGTWHDGTHIIPTADADDGNGGQSDAGKPTSSETAPSSTQTKGHDGGADDGGKGGESGNHRRGALQDAKHSPRQDDDNPFFTQKEDSDDAGFVDQPLSAAFNFTGSAIYVYALIPLFAAATNTTPTFVNLSYTLDNKAAGSYLHAGSPSSPALSNTTSYLSSFTVFEQSGLSEGPHTLTVTVGTDSVLLLDYILYSQESQVGSNPGSPSGSPSTTGTNGTSNTTSVGTASPSAAFSQTTPTTSSSTRSHNVATFAGAVGGSVGLLSILALSLAFSLYRRRLRAARRDRAYREAHRGETGSVSSFHTDGSEDGPPMQGPAPFVPRYFPGTVITAAPPPYSPPAPPSSEATSALLGPPETSMLWYSRRNGDSDSASYADRPPPTPPIGAGPDADDGYGYFAPPPSFPIAIATPVPAILAGLSGTTSNSPSPAPRPSTPTSPIIPLLAPPPSSRPITIASIPVETPGAGPSGTRSIAATEHVGSARSSIRSIQLSPAAELPSQTEREPCPQLPHGVDAIHPVISFTGSSVTVVPVPHESAHGLQRQHSQRGDSDRNSIGH